MIVLPVPATFLLPHLPPMVLLDAAIRADEQSLTAVTRITADHPFMTRAGVPIHVGVEMMAQTCGAFVGWQSLTLGETIRPGLLLGVRQFTASVPFLHQGEQIESQATVVMLEEELGVFACRLLCRDEEIACAQLSLMRPNTVNTLLEILRGEDG
ncbi:MAG: hypothetical protein HQL87_03135 [Magnetococcales bacterium]|nr:hypothetical protein [Magnetococcales bacterium]